MEEVRYYNSPISLEEAEQYIQSGLITAARAYVANGYYLHRIREDKLFEEAGYQNFEDYVRGKYNKDKGWASKCIKVNQQLSEGGDSPILSKQYLEYSTYQLVELAYMSEEQREEAAPDMTVNQLKQIRKPEEAVEPEKSCDVATSEPEEKEQDPEETQESGVYHFLDKHESIDDAYGWIRSEMVKEYLKNGYKSPDKEYEAVVFGKAYKVLKRENVTVFYNISGTTLFDVENERLEREYNYFFGDRNTVESESKEPENVPEQAEGVPESPETVIDGEFVELILPEPVSIKTILEEEQEELQNWIEAFRKEGVEELPPIVERQKIIVAALAAMVDEQEQPDPEPAKQEQPELPILKNNDQRATFIDAYETWPLWIETKETGERYYRYNLPDGTSIVVKVYHARIFDYHVPGSYEDKYKEGWGEPEYYLLKDGKFFRNCRTSRPDLIEKLKELQKKGKDKNHVEN